MLYELIYSSRASSNITNDMLENVLETSRINNLKDNITGLLIFDGSTFCQILEGEKDVIESTYNRIKHDNRHIDHSLFHSGEIEERNFLEWSMSFKRVQKQINTESWTDWFAAQKIISEIPSNNTLGCLIFKLINGSGSFHAKHPLGLK